MNIFRKFRAYLQLREAVRQADEAHAKDGDRYYVVPGTDGKLILMDRKNFRKLKQKGYITRKARIFDLERESFYFTPYADGNYYLGEADRKKKILNFFSWYEANRKAQKEKRQKEKEEKKKAKKEKKS